MSRTGLFRTTCEIRSKVVTTDEYGQYKDYYVILSEPSCGMRELSAREVVALGLPVDKKAVRVYLESGTNINSKSQIIVDEKIYEVVYVDKLGERNGLCKGLQVDCIFIGFCQQYDYSSSSSSSSSSSEMYSSSSSSSYNCCVSRYSTNPVITARFSGWEVYANQDDNLPDCRAFVVAYTFVIGLTIYQSLLLRNSVSQNIAGVNMTSAGWFNILEQNGSGVSGRVYWNGNHINQPAVVNELYCT